MHWKSYRNRKWLVWFIVICVVVVYLMNWWFSQMNIVIMQYLEILEERQLKQDVTQVLQEVIEHIDYDANRFVKIETGDDGYITSVYYDSAYLQEVMHLIIVEAQNTLQEVSEFVYEMKLGMFTRNIYLANTGPIVRLKLKTQPYLQGELNIKMEPYGLNNTLLMIGVDVHVHVYTVSPLIHQTMMITCNFPLVIQVIGAKASITYPYEITD